MPAKNKKIIEKQTLVETPNQPKFSPKLLIPVFLIITGLLAAATGYFFSQNLKLKKQTASTNKPLATPSKKPQTVSPTSQAQNNKEVPYGDENLDTDKQYQEAMKNPQYIPPYGWKKYITKDNKYLLYYPPDWILTDKSEDVDLYKDGNVKFQENIIISKGEYIFTSYDPLAWGPNVCLYPDSPSFEGPGSENRIEKYLEIKGNDGTYRREEKSDYSIPQSKLRWFICKKGEDGFFTGVAGFGSTYYDTPTTYDSNILIILDEILASLKTNN